MTAPAVQWAQTAPWGHQWLDFHGDRLAIHVPSGAQLNAFQVAHSPHVSPRMRSEMTTLFATQVLSPESYERVMFRMVDPDEPEYTADTFTELINEIVNLGAERMKAKKPRKGRHRRRRVRG